MGAGVSRKVNAKAFAVGNDVFLGEGESQPGSISGRKRLAHESTHTLQQKGEASKKIMRSAKIPEDEYTEVGKGEGVSKSTIGAGGGVKKIFFQQNEPTHTEKRLELVVNTAMTDMESLGSWVIATAKMMTKAGSHDLVDAKLTGFASVEGKKDYNKALSARRNEVVRKWLKQHMIDNNISTKIIVSDSEAAGEYPGRSQDDVQPKDRYVYLDLFSNAATFISNVQKDGKLLFSHDAQLLFSRVWHTTEESLNKLTYKELATIEYQIASMKEADFEPGARKEYLKQKKALLSLLDKLLKAKFKKHNR